MDIRPKRKSSSEMQDVQKEKGRGSDGENGSFLRIYAAFMLPAGGAEKPEKIFSTFFQKPIDMVEIV